MDSIREDGKVFKLKKIGVFNVYKYNKKLHL